MECRGRIGYSGLGTVGGNGMTALREKLGRGGVVVGTWVQMASEEAAEMAGYAGFDYVIVDGEHGHFGVETAARLIRAAEAAGTAPIVRVADHAPIGIMKALDAGAAGVLVPGVATAEQARRAVAAARYAPTGERGACPAVRATHHGLLPWPEYSAGANRDALVWLIVEGPDGARNFEEILGVEGVDGVMLGPFDLAVALGCDGDVYHPRVVERLAEMTRQATARGVAVAAAVFEVEPAAIRERTRTWLDLGCRILAVGGDRFVLAAGFRRARDAAVALTGPGPAARR